MSENAAAGTRRTMLLRLAGVVVSVAVLYAGWDYFIGSRSVSTDNAYVGADVASVTPLVSGSVAKVLVDETSAVKAGDVLVELDTRDFDLAVTVAESELEQARRVIQQARSQSDALSATAEARAADWQTARNDLTRTTELHGKGNASLQALQHAQDTAHATEAAFNAAQAEVAANKIVAGEGEVDAQPQVRLAQAKLEQAKLDRERASLRAPVDGVIAKRNVQLGQHVSPGAALMAVVPVQAAYVDANFKESQLAKVRVGQEAEMVSDLYGGGVVFHGKVVGVGGGTGSAFALIPAQNATGNWIKVVQRLPIRISLDPQELAAHPLRVGLSMEATIDLTSTPE